MTFVWLTSPCAGQIPQPTSGDYLVHVWQTDDGLAQNWVSSIAQTPDGYLWIGTRAGSLARFDGVRFVRFTPQNTPELKDGQIERLAVDERGVMWIATSFQSVTGMRDGQFKLFRAPHSERELRLESVLVTTPQKMLFVANSIEIAELDQTKGTNGWQIFRPSPAVRAFSYNIYPADAFHCDGQTNLWYVDQNQHLALFSTDGRQAKPEALQSLNGLVKALATDKQGRLWIATAGKIVSWDGHAIEDQTPVDTDGLDDVQQMTFSGDGGLWVYSQPPQSGTPRLRKLLNKTWVAEAETNPLKDSIASRYYKLYGDSRGDAWIASYAHGLLHACADGKTHLLTEHDGLPNDLVTCWFEDNEGNIWIGTAGGGIARIRNRVFQVLGQAEGLPEKVVRTVAVDSAGDILAGTMSGKLARWHDGRFTLEPLPLVDPTPLGGDTVWPSRTGSVWVGGLYHGLMRLRDGRINRIGAAGNLRFIRVFFEDSRNALWIGGQGSLSRFDSGNLKTFGREDGFPPGTPVGAIAEDTFGAIWIGTGVGELWRFHENKFTRFHPPSDWPPSRFASLQIDTNGIVWIGTLGNGLARFENGAFARFTSHDGLPDDNVTQLLDDGKGSLWGGTENDAIAN